VQTIDSRDTYLIETKPGDATGERLFVDRQTGLIVRDEVQQKHETFTFEDFRSVDGVRLPFVVHQTTPRDSYVYRFSEGKHLTRVDESLFEPR